MHHDPNKLTWKETFYLLLFISFFVATPIVIVETSVYYHEYREITIDEYDTVAMMIDKYPEIDVMPHLCANGKLTGHDYNRIREEYGKLKSKSREIRKKKEKKESIENVIKTFAKHHKILSGDTITVPGTIIYQKRKEI